MKKILFITAIVALLSSCTSRGYDLEQMGKAVESHIKYRDIDNMTITKVKYLKALSYEKIPEDKRENPEEVYLCKVHIQGTWSYDNSYRIFNINDTIDCYFSGKKVLLRMQDYAK